MNLRVPCCVLCSKVQTVRIPSLLIFLSSAILFGQPTNPVELIKQTTPNATAKVAYGTGPLQFGELRVPSGRGPFPVVVLVHGGCWSAKLGNLPDNVVSYELLKPLAAALAQAGIATWNIEYRRLVDEGAGWPGSYLDLGNGADELRKLAKTYPLDLTRLIAMGHSSGAQLALWLVARHKLPKQSELHMPSPLKFRGVIGIDGPPDIEGIHGIQQVCGGPVVTQFMGGNPSDFPKRYREGSITAQLPTGVTQELFLAKHDDDWNRLFTNYIPIAEKAGDVVRLHRQDDANHFDALNPKTKQWEAVVAAIKSLVR